MPNKRAESKPEAQTNILSIILIVLVWLLIKLGQFEFFLIRALVRFAVLAITYPAKTLKRIQLPKLHLPSIKNHKPTPNQIIFQKQTQKRSLHLNLSRFLPKKRGRPRTQPLVPFYSKKFSHLINRIFPKPIRIATLVVGVILLIFAYSLGLVIIAHDLPSPNRLKESNNPITSEFYDRNGKLLYRLFEGRNRTLVKLEDLPPHLINATIAIEDKNFYSHPGIDLYGIIRAVSANLKGQQTQGGSTLTQQLIKNTLLTPQRTWQRKLQELILSFWAERIFAKKEIMQMYLNEISYGGPTLGIEAASLTFFGKNAKNLTLAEGAYLAGLPASPTTYSPYGPNPQLALDRQKAVLRRMAEDGYISEEESIQAASENLNIKPYKPSLLAPHFVMYVKSYLEEKYGARLVSQGGLKVYTSLDLDLQQTVENIVGDEVAKLANLRVSNGAAMVMDPKTGQILAMIGSKDYYDPQYGNYNVTLALRQPGSSIKPITYATGFKFGYTPGTILLDSPTTFHDGVQPYSPINYDGSFHGPVTIRTALGSSYNIPAVKMLAIVGLPSMLQTARDLGITTLNDIDRYGLSLTLGAGEVKMIDMVTAYSTFSQMGVKHYPTPVLKITDSNGNVLEDNSNPPGVRVLNPGIAYMIVDILSDNKARTPAFGQNSLLNIPNHQVPVKTGTTDSKKDNWTFGFTQDLVVGVWVGNNDNTPMDQKLTSGITGAAPIWSKIMTYLLKDKDPVAFKRPDEISEASVDGGKDLTLSGLETKTVVSKKVEKKEDEKKEKEVITFTDPFSTYTQPDQPPTAKP